MKYLIPLLLLMLIGLQYRLWIGEGSLADVVRLDREIAAQQQENERLKQRNDVLAAEVRALKSGDNAVEERAREDLGMIKQGETFYLVIKAEE
ncbi:cell division protein FtsB [Candidatus Pelagadaptatus aseana]|uniref:cell division protein FtsB n=1 Tax=Candidatus Pelagadaptatus aseana TaxID=3120508 RepID=UPI003C703467